MFNYLILPFLLLVSSQKRDSEIKNEVYNAPKRIEVTVVVKEIECLGVDDGRKGSKDGEEIYGYIRVEPGLLCRDLRDYDKELHPITNKIGLGVIWSRGRSDFVRMKKGDKIMINKASGFDIPLPVKCGIKPGQFVANIVSNIDEYDGGNGKNDDKLEDVCKARECSYRWPAMDMAIKGFKEEFVQKHKDGNTLIVVKFRISCTPVYN